ncbi:amidohydrolase family protein [Ructibacterium gallinarum]|uniref:Amidohydrolase n=1 Tax=Ructibacterium gallinarum TaxID=2779355 RepID=A0A9D5LX21_9FIRM|nr:amidohydrolase family protein [Ructibacterium gallinarum]MBE5039376.1 amidohydrolase [Ructibacterium gallinarum]
MIIDAHAHIFPHKISKAATQGISDFYQIPIPYDGTLETLLQLGKEAGVSKFIVHSVATVPEQVPSINRFLEESITQYPDTLIGFMAMHPDYSDIEDEILRASHKGLKGIKLHPDFQQFRIDDPKAFPIYEAAGDRFPILIHMGDYRYSYSKPAQLAKILKLFPKLRVIAAHFGGWSEWDDAAKYLKNFRLWVDTSSSSHWLPPEQLMKLILCYGTDSILFGTDYPMWNHKDELAVLRKLPLTPDQLDKILYKNAKALLNLK